MAALAAVALHGVALAALLAVRRTAESPPPRTGMTMVFAPPPVAVSAPAPQAAPSTATRQAEAASPPEATSPPPPLAALAADPLAAPPPRAIRRAASPNRPARPRGDTRPLPPGRPPAARASIGGPGLRPAAAPAPPDATSRDGADDHPSPQPASVQAGLAWQGALAAWLQAHRSYPEAARRDGVEGRALIRFTVAADGGVGGVALVQSSGSALLDAAALAMLHDARLPAFPPGMARREMTVTVPVRYVLRTP